MRVLRQGDRGADVKRWQFFLVGQNLDVGVADGIFGARTHLATLAFQQRHGLVADGIVANRTVGQAALLGFEIVDEPSDDIHTAGFPPKPTFKPLVGTAARQQVFGKFSFVPKPVPGNRENIEITDDWAAKNIIVVTIPQLKGVPGAGSSGKVQFHRAAADQMVALWQAWDDAGLIDRVLSWGGSFVPRFVRGSKTTLSNHAFGSAFDINVPFNPLGVIPALVGKKGSVRELVPLANQHGFFWGGHFAGRLDGMHFEIAKIL
ncbi:M15 family metallopeptidase [Longimicrobium sp.]|uniref:M15 family metallopeptidase n=1 Tax=Longimicrobium sp. TaxID=2029185 RepID=UPI003B3AB4AD